MKSSKTSSTTSAGRADTIDLINNHGGTRSCSRLFQYRKRVCGMVLRRHLHDQTAPSTNSVCSTIPKSRVSGVSMILMQFRCRRRLYFRKDGNSTLFSISRVHSALCLHCTSVNVELFQLNSSTRVVFRSALGSNGYVTDIFLILSCFLYIV